MDHIHIPEGCRPQALPVPYLGIAPKYDRLGFDGFPERNGKTIDALISSNSNDPQHELWIESFFQEWLWFGLMDECIAACEFDLDLDDFIAVNPSGIGRVVTTAPFVSLIANRTPQFALYSDWMMNNFQLSSSSVRIKLVKSIRYAEKVLEAIVDNRISLLRSELSFSVSILIESMMRLVEIYFGETINTGTTVYTNVGLAMRARNWCPSRIPAFASGCKATLRYISSLLPSYQSESHQSCSIRRCLKPQHKTVAPSHRNSCVGDCLVVRVNERETTQMWKNGGIPGFRQGDFSKPALPELIDCTKKCFVALSHVWSHGLGNTLKSELPSCQFNFVSDLVKQIAGIDAAVWIDTLSVPIDPEGKRIAVTKLRDVYQDAHKVLVLDKDLMQVGGDKIEQIMQLLCSQWQRRLWTLQEGRLARELYVQFKDGAVPISELMSKTKLNPQTTESASWVFEQIFGLQLELKDRFSQVEQKDHMRFYNLVEDLAQRSVTFSADEPICLATMLVLDLEEYHPYPTMIDIYRSFPGIPQDLIFLRLPRLQEKGFGWAPSTFLENSFVTTSTEHLPGQLCAEGIQIAKDCLVLHHDIVIRADPEVALCIIRATNGENNASDLQFYCHFESHSSAHQISNPIIIWKVSPFKGEGFISSIVLASILHEKGETIYCKFVACGMGWVFNSRTQYLHERYVKRGKEIEGPVPATFMGHKSLCVD
jgi:hypothetical protein